MKLIIFSYPLHYRLSLIAEQFARKYLPEVTEVIFAWDDLAPDPNNYKKVLQRTRNTILYSEFDHTTTEQQGWIRQQYVKLQLHHKFDDPCWLLLDGDVILREPLQFQSKPTPFLVGSEYHTPYFIFIKHCLGLDKKNNLSFISPLNLFEREVLKSLEDYSIKRNGVGVVACYNNVKDQYKNMLQTLSEFEIYGTFATQILNRSYDYKYVSFISTDTILKSFLSADTSLVLHGIHTEEITGEEALLLQKYLKNS